ncbi:meiotic recombination protein REC8 homolog [Mytilus galloprovincialis]|uniref:meiotic recombination protein REC8 homolog n=1 Tax=Mytilus galloprovincialis TaxID=29158 RepID=UPI003F7C4451
MFYHQSILQRRGGKFGTVWLAATKIDQLKRRDFSAVDIKRTCDDILDYILVRIMPKKQGSGHPRFSLYLSSQLMYGVIRVFKRQNEYLLDDVTNFFCKMRIAVANLEEIDLKAMNRQEQLACDLDDLCADNPWFGVLQMDAADLLKSPQIPDMEMWRIESSLAIPRSPLMSPPLRLAHPSTPQISITEPMLKPDMASPHTVSSKEEITIPDIDMTIFQDIQFQPEHDLPPFDGKLVDIILEEPLPGDLQMGKFLSPVKVPQYEEMQQDLVQGLLSPKERTPMTKPDKSSVPERRAPVLSPGVTPMPQPEEPVLRPRRARASFTLQLSPVPPSPRRQRKRRHLCIDAQCQILKDQLKQNFTNREDIMRTFVLPDLKKSSVQDLFNNPGRPAMARQPQLLQLWRRNAVYGLLETDSDIGQPAWSVPDLLGDEEPRPTRSKRRLISQSVPQLSPVQQLQEPDIQIQEHELPRPDLEAIPEHVMEEQPSTEMMREGSLSRSRLLDDTPVSIHQKSTHSETDKSKDLDKSKGKEEPTLSKSKRKSRSKGSISTEEEMDLNLIPDISENQSVLQESLAQLSSIMEEPQVPITPVPLPVVTTTTPTAAELLRLIRRYTREEEWTTFQAICSPNQFDRTQAAKIFSDLIDLCRAKKVKCEQEEAFEDIYIWRTS